MRGGLFSVVVLLESLSIHYDMTVGRAKPGSLFFWPRERAPTRRAHTINQSGLSELLRLPDSVKDQVSGVLGRQSLILNVWHGQWVTKLRNRVAPECQF
jgi:hypothetical protein